MSKDEGPAVEVPHGMMNEEEAVRENESRYRALFELSSVGQAELDPETLKLDRVNRRLCEMLGYARPELIGASVAGLVHPDEHEQNADAWLKVISGENPELSIETRLLHKRGGTVWAHISASLLRDPDGRPIAIIAIVQDIGKRKRAEEALRESEDRYRLIVESARDYAIFVADPRGVITTWPPGAAAVFGWSAEEAVGQPSAVLFVPEDLATGEVEKELNQARETGVAPDVRWHLRRDGSRVFIEGWTRALRDADGQVRGFLKIGQDITQRRRIEAALRESEERFRTLVISLPQLVFRSAGSGERTWGSPQWEVYTGLSDAASRGYGWMEAVHPDDREVTLQAWENAKQTGQYQIEHRIRHVTNAEYRWHQTRAVPLPALHGGEREWVGSSADVHDLRQLKEEQAILVAELQHRTRNLLGIVLSLMQQTLMSSDTLETFAAKFGDRLAALSRVQGLLTRTNREPITIGALVRMELDALGSEAARDRIVQEGPQVTLPDSAVQTLSLALHELGTNARKYGALSSSQGRLTVSWRLKTDAAQSLLLLEWAEKGAKPRKAKGSMTGGFGRTLIEQALPASLGAKTSFILRKDGVYCSILLPLR
jgi:PAS domain S-box-containing protein